MTTPAVTRLPRAAGPHAPAAPGTAGDVGRSRASASRRVTAPRIWSVRVSDMATLVVANGALILAMWVRHGGLDQVSSLPGILTAAGQLTALSGTYVALIGLVLVSRIPWLDRAFGMDQLLAAHRWTGFATVWLLAAHVVFTTAGYATGAGVGFLDQIAAFVRTYPFVLWAAVAMGLFVVLAAVSVRAARRRASYETWYGIHLYAYLAMALGFAHQLAVGTDFVGDPIARTYWIALFGVVFALLLVFRVVQPVALSLRHRLRVANVEPEGPGVVSVYVTGRHLERLAVRSGQYFLWRFLTRDGWWRAHPFSLSAAPNGSFLRLTVKALGDDTRALQHVAIGTAVAVEGPYGALTGDRRTRRKVALIGGGIGIAPLRALFEDLPGDAGDIALLFRASSTEDLVLRDELDAICRVRRCSVHYLVGRRGTPEVPGDPLAPERLAALVPDIRDRDVYLCGPVPMMDAVRRSLMALGLSRSQIHFERFAY